MPSEFISQGAFLFYTYHMETPQKQNYITRLICLGYPCHCALRIYKDFLRTYHSVDELEDYVSSLEEDNFHVDRVQCKPHIK